MRRCSGRPALPASPHKIDFRGVGIICVAFCIVFGYTKDKKKFQYGSKNSMSPGSTQEIISLRISWLRSRQEIALREKGYCKGICGTGIERRTALHAQKGNMGYKDLVFDEGSIFLVTGGAGFIGSNLCEAILNMGYTVRCLDNLSTGKYENIEPFTHLDKFTFIKGDIRDLDTCLEATKGVDYVLNQAAWGSVPRSIEMPLL